MPVAVPAPCGGFAQEPRPARRARHPPHKSLPPGGPRQRRDPVGEGCHRIVRNKFANEFRSTMRFTRSDTLPLVGRVDAERRRGGGWGAFLCKAPARGEGTTTTAARSDATRRSRAACDPAQASRGVCYATSMQDEFRFESPRAPLTPVPGSRLNGVRIAQARWGAPHGGRTRVHAHAMNPNLTA
jgi:hypothetical protein